MRTKLILSLTSLLVILAVATACGGGAAKPEHYGVFLKQGSQLSEIPVSSGGPSQDTTIPKTSDPRPVLTVFLPDTVLDYLSIVDRLGDGDQVLFTAKPVGDETIELQPRESLAAGAYCLIKGDPLGSPSDTPYYCFQVGTSAVGSTPGADLPPTPKPMSYATEVAAAATALVNPGNAATQSAAEQVLKMATATVEAETAARWQAKLDKLQSALSARRACASRLRPKLEAGDYSEIRAGADLTGCDLSNLNLFGLDFSGVDLTYADLRGSNLQGAKFSAASKLDWADVRGANLDGVNFGGASMRLAVFSAPRPSGVQSDVVSRSLAEIKCKGSSCGSVQPMWIPAKSTIYWNADGTFYDTISERRIDPPLLSIGAPPTFSPDGKFAAWNGGVIDVETRETLVTYDFYFTNFHGWSQQGAISLWRDHNRSWVLDLSANKGQETNLDGGAAVISPDGQYLAAREGEGIALYNARTGSRERTLIGDFGGTRLIYSPDGHYLAVWEWLEDVVQVVAVGSGDVVWSLNSEGEIRELVWSPDSMGLALVEDNHSKPGQSVVTYMSVWTFGRNSPVFSGSNQPQHALDEGYGSPSVVWDPGSRWVAAAYDVLGHGTVAWGEIQVIAANSGAELAAEVFKDRILGLALSPTGDTLAAGFIDYDYEDYNLYYLLLMPVNALLAP